MKQTRITRRVIIIGAIAFAITALSLGYSLTSSFNALSSTADRLDDSRAVTATNGAVRALGKQLGSTIRDNAYWDDAYKTLQTPERESWIDTTWGSITADYPLYDTLVVIAPKGGKTVGYHRGKQLSDPLGFFDGSLPALIKATHAPEARETVPVAFVQSRHGPMLVGAAAIQPNKPDAAIDPGTLSIMIMGKEITPAMMGEISRNFSIRDLKLEDEASPGRLSTPLKDALGQTLYYFTWPPEKPGSKSLLQVKPALMLVAGTFIALLAGIIWAAWIFISDLRSHEAAARFDSTHDQALQPDRPQGAAGGCPLSRRREAALPACARPR